MIDVTDDLHLDDAELVFQASPGGGPGGQNVNRVATKVSLRFDVLRSPNLDEAQRARLLERLATRLTRDGVLQVVSSRHRTQGANRRDAEARLIELLQDALEIPPERRPTRPSRAVHRKRLAAKRRTGKLKQARKQSWDADD